MLALPSCCIPPPTAMSAPLSSVAAGHGGAQPRGTDAAAHSAAAASAAATAAPAQSDNAFATASLAHELAAVKQRIVDVEEDIKDAKKNRQACTPGSDLWKEYHSELKQLRTKEEQLRTKEEQLRDELKQLRTKEEQLRDEQKRKEMAPPSLVSESVESATCAEDDAVAADLLNLSIDSAVPPAPPMMPRQAAPRDDTLRLPRTLLRQRLVQLLQQHRHVLFTAPPGSGKSTLLSLLREDNLRSRRCLRIPCSGFDSDTMSAVAFVLSKANKALTKARRAPALDLDSVLESFDYILFDDAHRLYRSPELWQPLIKDADDSSSCCLLFFASYNMQGVEADSPALPVKLGIQEARLQADEEEDLIQRIETEPAYSSLDWLPQLSPIVRAEAGGHVGLLRLMLQQVAEQFRDGRNPSSFRKAIHYYYNRLLEEEISARFFLRPNECSQEAQDVLQDIVRGARIPIPPLRATHAAAAAPDSARVKAIRQLLRYPMLVDDGGYLQFATPLHKRFFFRCSFRSCVPLEYVPADIDTWLLLVLSTFEPDKLRDPNSQGSGVVPKEGPLQHQFWRGACMCLPPQFQVAAEVSRVVEKGAAASIRGELDFWINSQLNWAFELMREGDRRRQHVERFEPHGAYAALQPAAWRVVDFRSSSLREPGPEGYVAVKLDGDFRGAEVWLPEKRTSTRVQFTGGLTQEQAASLLATHPQDAPSPSSTEHSE